MGGGANFEDQKNPRVMVQAGAPWTNGVLEITDIIFSTVGPGMLFKATSLASTQSSKHPVLSSSSGTCANLGTSREAQACGTLISGMSEYLVFDYLTPGGFESSIGGGMYEETTHAQELTYSPD